MKDSTFPETGMQELYDAVETGKVSTVKKILTKYPQLINIRPLDGGTWLHLACMSDHVGIVQAFLDAGIDINLPYEDSPTTPLDTAANWGCFNVARLLLKNGAQIDNTGGDRGTTPRFLSKI